MYCPNCGVEIHEEGAFCAKCRKDVTYLTRLEESAEEVKEAEAVKADGAEMPEDAEGKAASAPPKARPVKPAPLKAPKKGYYCNYCGTFLYPEDNYCYDCGKTTRKKFYPQEKKGGKHLRLLFAAGLIVLLGVASACAYYWCTYSD